jgi:hypothetical protein
MIIDGKELLRPFFNNKKIPKNFVIADKSYYCPTEEVLNNEIYPKYRNWLISLKLSKWSHKWDCDNFADAFKVFSNGYYQQNIESDAESIAIGTIHYFQDGNGHAINIVYLNKDNQIKLHFLEPQNGTTVNLSENKFQNIFSIYI